MYLILTYFVFYFIRAQSANILCVFVFPAVSHQTVFQTIWRELSLRGHNVTVVTPDPLNDPTLTNLTEISVRHVYDVWKFEKSHKILPTDNNIIQNVISIYRLLDIVGEAELNNTEFQTLINNYNLKFDLIIIEWMHDVMYSLAEKFKAPIVAVSSFSVTAAVYDIIGNPNHPVLYPDMIAIYHGKKLSLREKTMNFFLSVWLRISYHFYFLPRVYKMAGKYVDDSISYEGNLTKKVCGFFININPIIYPPRPLVPMLVEIGQMTLKPVKPLPKDLKEILDEAREGFIYFNLGSSFRTVDLEDNIRNVIIGALGELPYKVVWKWESDHLPGKPSNVEIRKWFPQQYVLAHPNIRAFVTQGGLQSVEEAISNAVPMVGLPLLADQPMNVQNIVHMGIGVYLNIATMTKEEFKNSIIEVCDNKSYKKEIEKVRSLLLDTPMKGIEKIVWWTEFFLRHKRVKHLRSPSADITWFNYLMIDVVLTFIILVFCVLCGVYMILQCWLWN